MRLFSYSHPRYAAVTLRRLRARWPANRFDVVLSPSMSYAFRYVIQASVAGWSSTRVPGCSLSPRFIGQDSSFTPPNLSALYAGVKHYLVL